MKSSIRWRLVMMYVLLVVIVMMVSGTMIVMMIRSNAQDEMRDEIIQVVQTIKDSYFVEDVVIDDLPNYLDSEQSKFNASVINNYNDKRIFFLDKESRVIYPLDASTLGHQFPTHQVMKAITDGTLADFDQDIKIPGKNDNHIGYAENIKVNDSVEYVIYVLGNTSAIEENTRQIVLIILMSVGVALFIAVVLGFIFSDFLTKPISALSRKARDMQRGRLDQPMRVYANDEIGQLTKNFNKMATSLNDTLNEITSEKNKLEIVFKHMTDGILVFDKSGIMIHSNPMSISMLKLEKEISFQEIFRPYLEVTYREMKETVKDETVSHMVEVEGKYYSVYFAKFLDQYNEAVGLICVIQDITEHKKLEEIQKEFVANVSHELRTPLTTIKSYAETLLEGALDDRDTAERFLGVINHEGDRMTALVQDLLELSKLDNSQVKFSMHDLNLEYILEDSINKLRIHSEKKSQSMIYHPPIFECRIVGDVNRIEQVIKNIISNAVKYSQDNAIIEIDVKEVSKYICVSIRDNGMGISKEDLKRIFDRFYRVDKARSREMGGTGLGLAIASEIMEYHGGKIEVTSEPGSGTTFELYFLKKLGNSH